MFARRLCCMGVLIALAACDEPTPTVLGHLKPSAHDAGERPDADAEHERDRGHDEAQEHTERDEREAPSERD